MDAVDFASGSRKRRIINEDVGLGKDFISNLPEENLHQVLSFLPTKDLVRTSVLSKRWQKVWTYFSVIDIDLDSVNKKHELRTDFLDFVERAMLLASTARIRKFRLRLLARIGIVDASDIMLWVDKVMEHKVQELYLDIPFYSLPHRFFSSNSLTELKLTMDDELMVPDSVCFPRLKILHLSLVKFSSVQSTEKLFSSCPVLEDLVLNFCNWERIDSIVLHFPSLRTLSFDHPEYLPASKIKISAPNLLSFKCRHQVAIDLDLCNLSSLEDASIGIDFGFIDPASSVQQAVKLIHGIRGAKSLTLLLNNTLEALLFEKDLHASLPTFDNLKHLGVGCAGGKSILRALMEVLRKTPNLHSLRVDGADNAFMEQEGILNTVPQ